MLYQPLDPLLWTRSASSSSSKVKRTHFIALHASLSLPLHLLNKRTDMAAKRKRLFDCFFKVP